MMVELTWQTLAGLGVPSVLGIGAAMMGVLWWAAKHYFVRRDEFDRAVRERNEHFAQADIRMTAIESRLDDLPTAEQLAGLRGDFRALSTQMDGLATAQQTMSRQLETLTRFLLEHKS